MSIQGAFNTIVGNTERAIGIYKYFVDTNMQSPAVSNYVQGLKQEGNEAIKNAQTASEAAVKASEDAKNYRGRNYKKGQEIKAKALYDAEKAVDAAYEVTRNIRGIMQQKTGSLFDRSKFLGQVHRAQREAAVNAEATAAGYKDEIKKMLNEDEGGKR